MNLFKKTMMAAGMASVALVPVAATAAAPVASIASARTAPASSVDDSALRGRDGKRRGGAGIILGILAAALIIVGIVIAVDSNNNDRPVSP